MTPTSEQTILNMYADSRTGIETINKLTGIPIRYIYKILNNHKIPIKQCSTINRKYTLNENYFGNIDSHEKAYWLGWMASDGSISHNNVCLQIQISDIEVLENLKKSVGFNGPISIRKQAGEKIVCGRLCNIQDACRISFYSNKMMNSLIKHGLDNNKSYSLIFPDTISEELLPSFVRGYWEGDGSLNKSKRSHNAIIVSTENFCNKLKSIIIEKLKVNVIIQKAPKCHSTFLLSVCGSYQCLRFLNWIYSTDGYVLKRKYNQYLNMYHTLNDNPRSQSKTKQELLKFKHR